MFYNNSDSESDSEDSSFIVIANNIETSDSETDKEIDTDSEDEIEEFEVELNDWEYDEIYQEDSNHVYSEKEDNHYYIGLTKRLNSDVLLMMNSISPTVFFRYSFSRVREYLVKYSIMNIQNAKVHIMKLCILPDETYSVVLKTHWLRLVQRHWRKVYNERMRVIKGRRNIKNQSFKEIRGKYPYGLNRIPSIQGMLNHYAKNSNV